MTDSNNIEILSVIESIDPEDDHPFFIVTYRSGLTEYTQRVTNSKSELGDVQIRGPQTSDILPKRADLDPFFYFLTAKPDRALKACNKIMFDHHIFDEDGNLDKNFVENIEDADMRAAMTSKEKHRWISALFKYIAQENEPYTELFNAALILYEMHVSKNYFKAGYINAAMTWKLSHGDYAQKGINQAKSLKAATVAQEINAPRTAAKRQAKILELLKEVYEDHPDLTRNDSGAAREIIKIANELKPRELIIKTSGTVLGPDAIKKHIATLRTNGKI